MKTRKGFSLIEIGIVMVVIGLIIAAVMKGKDVIQGAEVKQVNQEFLNKWINIADSFYDKTGKNLDEYNTTTDISSVLAASGVAQPKTGQTKSFSGESTSEANIIVGFAKATDSGSTRHVVTFTNIPGDIAIAYDKLVDGDFDPAKGKARIISTGTTTAATSGIYNTITNPTDINSSTLNLTTVDATKWYDMAIILER